MEQHPELAKGHINSPEQKASRSICGKGYQKTLMPHAVPHEM